MQNSEEAASIIPALMPEQFSDIEKAAEQFAPFVECMQIDVMDGVFVSNTSWPYGVDQWSEVEQLAQRELQLPHKGAFHYEAHLMVSEPERIGELLARGGVERLIMHVETLEGIDVESMCASWKAARASEIGVAILLDTPIERIEPYLHVISFIQVMGIDKVGFQGESFDQRALAKIGAIRNMYPGVPLEFDGGVGITTIARIVSAGVSRLVVGSALMNATDAKKAYDDLTNAIQ